ncbi:CRISPR-associated endonuclease Cas1 [Philodulcilactobacillus myokoensis]|uniref:CRISPR-associated endonuclease Cas1 n=1 Tax=Philodulcilactobacillus myokoensis TaxID=2929573 RepID=A0A9W6ETJ4_9LACO|nr:type II CRISPR-associated endonuclease Cas1 [Philodulcilactobacillus myokoensis]GLB47437.1 CRISPR-associated endonuclease Cas1 [Philodulcilactobacillus myokoensis]
MGWRSVIISQHAKLSYSAHSMNVQTMDGINIIPIDDIYLVLVATTQAVITTELISQLNKKQVKIIFSDNDGEPACETINHYPNDRSLLLLNHQFKWSNDRKQILWTKIVNQKMINQISVLRIYRIDTKSLDNELDKLEVGDTTNREAVVARKYFKLLFGKEYSRRDFLPMNAALNYGYSILLSDFNREITANGYLTYLGIHHHSEENHFNLGSDLMEPFRPVIDLWLANQRFNQLTPDVKFGLVRLLNIEVKYNGRKTILKNAIAQYTRNCLKYLTKGKDCTVKVELINEVPNNAINDNV